MGIKLFEFLRRANGTTAEEFHAYWRDTHAAKLADEPDLRRHVNRYELNHQLPDDSDRERRDGEVENTGWDGVAVLWFDSVDAIRALAAEPAMAAIRDDVAELPRRRAADRRHRGSGDHRVHPSPRRGRGQDAVHPAPQRGARPRHVPRALDDEPRRDLPDDPRVDRSAARATSRTTACATRTPRSTASPSSGSSPSTRSSSPSPRPAHTDVVSPDVAYMLDPASINFIMAGKPTVVIE